MSIFVPQPFEVSRMEQTEGDTFNNDANRRTIQVIN